MQEFGLRSSQDKVEIRVRKAISTDISALAELEAQAFDYDRLSRRSLALHVRNPRASLLVATDGELLAGYALLLFRRGSRSAWLYSLAVRPEAAGRGIGSRLLAAAEAAARERGVAEIRLEVRADNEAAIRLYETRFYRRTGMRAGYYEDGANALCFALSLAGQSAARTPVGRAA